MTPRSRWQRATALSAVAVAAVTALAGCAFNPSTLPVPGTTVSGHTYSLHIQFANVLNLPPGAKVVANGVVVGNLTGMSIHDTGAGGYVTADIAIKDTVRLPTSTHAELRQSTPLGDIHIALTTPPDGDGPDLAPDATIPIAQTTRAPQVEDTLAGLATAVSGGTVTNFEDIVRQLNTALPKDPTETARIFGVVGNDLTDVAAHLGSVDSILDGLQANARQTLADNTMLAPMLTDYGVRHVTDVLGSVVGIIYILTALGPLSHRALWLAPLVGALDSTAKAVVPVLFTGSPLDLKAPSNLNKLVELIQDKIIPFVQLGPKVNIVGAAVSEPAAASLSSTEQTDRIIGTLRMIGLVR